MQTLFYSPIGQTHSTDSSLISDNSFQKVHFFLGPGRRNALPRIVFYSPLFSLLSGGPHQSTLKNDKNQKSMPPSFKQKRFDTACLAFWRRFSSELLPAKQ
jgi:hypothetical protein